MRKAGLSFICLLLAYSGFSHPGTGIVKDSKGNIYYTDLQRVWKIAKDGKRSVAVPNVHTHELYMDAVDNLFGQHSMYSGEATNKWSHYVWTLSADGRLDTVIQTTEGFYIENFSFVRDSQSNMYWIQHGKQDKLMKTTAEGWTVPLATGNFKQVQWMHVMNGTLYFVRQDDILKVSEQGRIQTVAENLCRKENAHNTLFGLWNDTHNNLYVANTCTGKVQQIAPNGTVRDFYASEKGWWPSGGLFDNEKNLWLLEYNAANEIRVSKISAGEVQKTEKPKTKLEGYILPLGIALCLFGIGVLKWINKSKKK